MARIIWDALGERRYEIGVDRGVFYSLEAGEYANGIPWNGLTGVDDASTGREATPLYSGGVKAASEYTAEEYAGKIKCFTYPDEFEKYLGTVELQTGIFGRQQKRDLVAFCYRSFVGNDTEGAEHGYKIHIIYNCRVTDFSRSYSTINASNEIQETEISFETFPQEVDNDEYKPMSEIVLDSRFVDSEALATLEGILYGDDAAPRLPFPDEIIEMFIVPEPMPPEWYLYPNNLIYPADTLYPEQQEE